MLPSLPYMLSLSESCCKRFTRGHSIIEFFFEYRPRRSSEICDYWYGYAVRYSRASNLLLGRGASPTTSLRMTSKEAGHSLGSHISCLRSLRRLDE